MTTPANSENITIDGPVGDIEALIEYPEASEDRNIIAICCHPHPQHGGAMSNKVIYTVARAQLALGATALRFNFRGVGKSMGHYADGIGEMEDLRAVLNWVGETFPGHTLWLSGFSFGAWISTMVAHEYAIEQLISIAPPVERGYFENMTHPQCSWLALMGDADEVVSFKETEQWIETLNPKPEWIVMKDAGHFFHSRLVELREILEQTLAKKID
ncbi:MAG: alpha/beta fold hydrolase [Gammaproteobacteria bacterium]|nr:alpha/beta fold hydrolase [Gammaproteobacteria bacterium]